jgi:hypothetical protein
VPHLHRLQQHLLRHRLLLYICLDRITDFDFAYSVPGKTNVCLRPQRAPSSSKTRATPRPRWLRLHRLRHRYPSSTTASMHLRHSLRALCVCGFMCVYLDTGTRP